MSGNSSGWGLRNSWLGCRTRVLAVSNGAVLATRPEGKMHKERTEDEATEREESGLACKKRRPSCIRPSPPIAPTRDGPETGVLGGGSEQAGPLRAAFRILKEAPQLPGKGKAKGLSEERRWWEEGLGKTALEMADGVGGAGPPLTGTWAGATAIKTPCNPS